MSFCDVKILILYKLVIEALNKGAKLSGYLPFWKARDAIKYIELNDDEVDAVMKELEKAGVVELVNYGGWRLTQPPWLEKDCWEYQKKG